MLVKFVDTKEGQLAETVRGGTTYSKGGPSAAALMVPPDCPWQLTIAVEGPPGPSTAENVAVDSPGGLIYRGTSYRMTEIRGLESRSFFIKQIYAYSKGNRK